MTERKVLNKYYPPDFDPSKIPKAKFKRNATFEIRLMAPCNMRCTTCGEYIYKGRKFNARKEDVDDMNYLGLRIYRFYIKCTACVSEICFRTDPESCDYVLEAGATRNFEALKKAEELAEKEEIARQEELENNPMKLLEERTTASKNEMELVESLEELRELNKRTLQVDYDSMTSKIEQDRIYAASAQERADEEFVKKVFAREANTGDKVKRLVEESSSDEEKEAAMVKKLKSANPTDHLVEKKVEQKKQVWEKSIGSLGKSKLGALVKKKTEVIKEEKPTTSSGTSVSVESRDTIEPELKAVTSNPVNALGLLGAYSDSGSCSD